MAESLEALIESLQSTDVQVRAKAAESLAQYSGSIQEAAIPLIKATGSEHESLCEWACAGLEQLGPPKTSELAALAALVNQYIEDQIASPVAYWALTLIGRLETDALPAINAIVQAAELAKEPAVRERAVWCLGRMGGAARSVVPTLNRLSADKSPRLARLANQALTQIND